MSEHWSIYADWNPWHGCTKISPGCKYCHVYRQDEMYGSEVSGSECRKTANFNLPVRPYLDESIEVVSVGGESGFEARPISTTESAGILCQKR